MGRRKRRKKSLRTLPKTAAGPGILKMTSEGLTAPIKVVISSDSDESDDDSPIPVDLVRRRMPMCLKASEIDGKTSTENLIYTSKFLNYRKKRLEFIEAPNQELLDDKSNCDIEEEEDSIFTKNTKPSNRINTQPFTRGKKILAVEKHVDDIISSVAVIPDISVELLVDAGPEIPLVTRVSRQTASILKEFDEATFMLYDPKLATLNESNTSVSSESSDCLCVDDIQMSKEVSVKVRWRSTIKRFTMQSNDTFSTILPKLAKETGANISDILLALKDTTIKHGDTPESINLSIIDIIDCYVIKMIAETVDDSVIELKLQSENRWKKVVKIHKDSPMETLIEECASEKGIPANKVVFKFDGEVIDPSETPTDLDLESGLCIDVTFLS